MYFLIYCTENGCVSINQYEKEEELLQIITKQPYKNVKHWNTIQNSGIPLRGNVFQNYGEKLLVIKGEIVTSKPKKH